MMLATLSDFLVVGCAAVKVVNPSYLHSFTNTRCIILNIISMCTLLILRLPYLDKYHNTFESLKSM